MRVLVKARHFEEVANYTRECKEQLKAIPDIQRSSGRLSQEWTWTWTFTSFFQIGEKYVIDECDLHNEIKLGHKLNLRAGQVTNTFWFWIQY